MLTIEDIRNPARKAGFDHVGRMEHRSGTVRFQAQVYDKAKPLFPSNNLSWYGPGRLTAEEAAQDYCDYMNGNPPAVPRDALPSYLSVEIDMGNATVHAPKAEKVTVIREKYTGPHDVYDVLFVDPHDNDRVIRRKVGITARGRARYSDICTTLGFSIKPHAAAVTYPSEAKARAAEAKKVAEVCADPKWRRVGKESFAPNHERTTT